MVADLGRIGLWRGSFLLGDDPAALAETVAELDELGYGSFWLGTAKGDLEQSEAILDATKKMVVATGIVNVWTEPVETAAAAYHRVVAKHPGRLLLGIGAGHREMTQVYQKPYDALVNYLDALDAAKVPLEDVALAALGPRVTKLAGERTRGSHPYFTTPEHTAQAREILGTGPLLAPEQKVILDTNPETARAQARQTLGFYLGLANYRNSFLRLGFTEDELADGGNDRLVDATIAWGDVETVGRRITEHLDAGADTVGIQVLTEGTALPIKEWRDLAALIG
ncbi:LLM class F420-dependent oxidoreductase [Fodinicola feengrottensis]|uniref:LLM class F420-dependent oxidoreductase n=1 Tax=Fodinicola feengrottensis TaxID=435914 RepID=A0ABN2GDL3_9ACTN|nr:LLM class F420-dependent oxidoreductase [Fodinicola feengrottensis]